MSLVESVFKLIFHRQKILSQTNLRLGPLWTSFNIQVKINAVVIWVICMLCKKGMTVRGRKNMASVTFFLGLKSSKMCIQIKCRAVMKASVSILLKCLEIPRQ